MSFAEGVEFPEPRRIVDPRTTESTDGAFDPAIFPTIEQGMRPTSGLPEYQGSIRLNVQRDDESQWIAVIHLLEAKFKRGEELTAGPVRKDLKNMGFDMSKWNKEMVKKRLQRLKEKWSQ